MGRYEYTSSFKRRHYRVGTSNVDMSRGLSVTLHKPPIIQAAPRQLFPQRQTCSERVNVYKVGIREGLEVRQGGQLQINAILL